MKKVFVFFCLVSAFISQVYSQVDSLASGNIEIYLIDSYITPEIPHKMVVSFFTSDTCTSKIRIIGFKDLQVEKKFSDNHKIEIDVNSLVDKPNTIQYKIYVYDSDNNESQSQLYEVAIPQNLIIESDRDLGMLQVCCFGGIIFGLPSPTIVFRNNEQFFSLSKEIPLFSFYSSGYNYPWGYFSVEYAHIFNADEKNFVRTGYKHIFQTKIIEYISPGINYFSDFKGYNGISAELTIGLFRIKNAFTFFARYRNNFQPKSRRFDFDEISIGLYSNFFSLNF